MPSPSTSRRSRFRRFAKVAGINVLVLLTFAVVIELVLGSWLHGPEFGSLNVGVNAVRIDTDSAYYPPGTTVVYRRDAYGLRGDFGDPGEVTILAIGGSTTNDRVASEGDTWTDVLQRNLQAAGYDHVVANAGVDGHSSLGHIKSFELWYPNVPDLHPDYALIYVGHNDRGVAPGDVPQADTLTSPSWSRRLSSYISNHSIFSRAFKNLKGWIAARRINVTYGDVDTNPDTLTYVPLSDVELDAASLAPSLQAYHERLRLLNQMALEFGTVPVFVTQPVGLVRMGENGPEAVVNSGAGRIAVEMQLYNGEVLAFCREAGAICIDLAGDLAFEPQDFYDAIHTTPSGSRKIGEYLAKKWPDVVEPPG